MRRVLSVIGACTIAACATTMPVATVGPLRAGELAGSAWTVMGPGDRLVTGQRIVLDGTTVRAVLVPIVSANPGAHDAGVVTMTIVSDAGTVLARDERVVLIGEDGWARFPLPGSGLTLPAGSVVIVWFANVQQEVFGWRYQTNASRSGGAFILGRNDPQYDFVYRLDPTGTGRVPTAPVRPATDAVASTSPAAVAPRLVAHYPLTTDLNDASGNNGPLQVQNAPLDRSRGLFCGGPRALAGARTCDARTPRLPTGLSSALTIRARFLVPERLPVANPVFVGGASTRWVVYELQPDGGIRLVYSNSLRSTCSLKYRTNTWHEAAIAYDGQTIRLYLDNVEGCAVSALLDIGTDTIVLLNNLSNASAFYGFLRELRVYEGVVP